MLSVVIALTGLLFSVTSRARDSEKGDIVFNDAKLKEVDLSSAFKTTFNISDSIEKAKFAVIDDGTPKYFTVTKVNNDNTRTPLELKSDADGRVCTEIVYPEKGINELPYEVYVFNTDYGCGVIDTSIKKDKIKDIDMENQKYTDYLYYTSTNQYGIKNV